MIPALLGSLVRWLITLAGAQAWLTDFDGQLQDFGVRLNDSSKMGPKIAPKKRLIFRGLN